MWEIEYLCVYYRQGKYVIEWHTCGPDFHEVAVAEEVVSDEVEIFKIAEKLDAGMIQIYGDKIPDDKLRRLDELSKKYGYNTSCFDTLEPLIKEGKTFCYCFPDREKEKLVRVYTMFECKESRGAG